MKYAYYAGCCIKTSGSEFDVSFRKVCEKFSIELEEIPDWACCGSTPAHSTNHLLSLALPARIVSHTEKAGFDKVLIPCASCYQRVKFAQHEIDASEAMRKKLEYVVDGEIRNRLDVVQPLGLFAGKDMRQAIRKEVKKTLTGLKVCSYYGCLLTRPPKVMKFDEAEYPMSMDHILRAVGAETLDWNSKTRCCGASLAFSRPEHILKLSNDILADAKAAGGNAIAVACTLCHANLDMRQEEIEARYAASYDIPVFYFTQLLALALGTPPAELEFHKHFVDPMPMLKRLGLA